MTENVNSPPDPAERLHDLERRIDDIVAFQKQKKPWFFDASVSISLAAFLISLATTLLSAYRTHQQDVQSRKSQLKSTLSQVGNLGVQNAEYLIKYKDNPQLMGISVALNNQNVMLTKQAFSLAESLGANADTVDLLALASALGGASEFALSEEILASAATKAQNSVEYIAAFRSLGWLKYNNGAISEGRDAFQKAAEGFVKYPTNNYYYYNFTMFHTELYWAQVALGPDCKVSKERTAKAGEYLSKLPEQTRPGPSVQALKQLVDGNGSCS